MLIGERMSRPVITLSPGTTVNDAMHLMRSEHIRRAPVVEHGRLLGIVSMKDLLNASPSQATTLSVWELNYLLSKLTVERIMTRDVVTVTSDTPVEEAARLMADRRVGGLPVLHDGQLVGMITETDVFKLLLEMLGARTAGVRLTVKLDDHPGALAALTRVIADAGGNIVSVGTFSGPSAADAVVTLKVSGLARDELTRICTPAVLGIIDAREHHP